MTERWTSVSGHARSDSPSVRSLGVSPVHDHVNVTGHNQPMSSRFSASVWSMTDAAFLLLLLTGRIGPSETSVWSLTVTTIFSIYGAGGTVGLSTLYGRTLRQ